MDSGKKIRVTKPKKEYLSKLLNNKLKNPSIKTMKKIAENLNISLFINYLP